MAEVAIIGAIVATASSIASFVQNEKARSEAKNAANNSLGQGALSLGRSKFVSEITGKFQELSLQSETVFEIDSHLTKLEQRITTILSDYTSLLNQVSIVSTLMLGVATATFGSLLGNTTDQPQWKVNMYVISCVLTVCLSVYSVIESFFLSIHIYAEESRFIAGLYPHRETGARSFNLDTLTGLSSSYSTVIVTFFLSFLTFSVTIMSMLYIGLGLSNNVLGYDNTTVLSHSAIFKKQEEMDLSKLEPEFQSIAFTMTLLIVVTYLTILYFFLSRYINYVRCPYTARYCGRKCCHREIGGAPLEDPMHFTAAEFERIQTTLGTEFEKWNRMHEQFISRYEKCLIIQQDCPDTWDYVDIDYEIYMYKAFKAQLQSQYKKLQQMRLLQVTAVYTRNDLNLVGDWQLVGADTPIKF